MFKFWQLKAIRAAMDWSQGQLAKNAGVSRSHITKFENGDVDSLGIKVVEGIITACNSQGFHFTSNGIEKQETNSFTIEGDDCYLKLLALAQEKLSSGDYFLKNRADERRSSQQVIERLQHMRDDGIKMQSLIRPGDTYCMGALDEYRWLDEAVFVDGDVTVIFGDFLAHLVSSKDSAKVIVVNDKTLAEEARRYFNYFWKNAEQPIKSDASTRFNGVDNG